MYVCLHKLLHHIVIYIFFWLRSLLNTLPTFGFTPGSQGQMQTKLADFGLARRITLSAATMGGAKLHAIHGIWWIFDVFFLVQSMVKKIETILDFLINMEFHWMSSLVCLWLSSRHLALGCAGTFKWQSRTVVPWRRRAVDKNGFSFTSNMHILWGRSVFLEIGFEPLLKSMILTCYLWKTWCRTLRTSADIYSLGQLMYFIITTQRPYSGHSDWVSDDLETVHRSAGFSYYDGPSFLGDEVFAKLEKHCVKIMSEHVQMMVLMENEDVDVIYVKQNHSYFLFYSFLSHYIEASITLGSFFRFFCIWTDHLLWWWINCQGLSQAECQAAIQHGTSPQWWRLHQCPFWSSQHDMEDIAFRFTALSLTWLYHRCFMFFFKQTIPRFWSYRSMALRQRWIADSNVADVPLVFPRESGNFSLVS